MTLHSGKIHPPHKTAKGPNNFFELAVAGIPLLTSLVIFSFNLTGHYSSRFLIFLLFLCSLILFIRRIKIGIKQAKFGSITFIAGFVAWYSYPAFVGFFIPYHELEDKYFTFIDNEIIVVTIIYLSAFLLSGIGISFVPLSTKTFLVTNPSSFPLKRINSRIIALGALCACSAGIATYFLLASNFSEIITGIIESRALQKPWLQTSNLGDTISPFTFLASSAMAAGSFLFWMATADTRLSTAERAFTGLFALFTTAIIYFDQGTRSILLIIVAPLLTLRLAAAWTQSPFRAIAILLAIIVIGHFILQFQLLYRASFSRANLPELFFEKWLTLGGTIDFFKETLLSVSLVPTYHEYFRESVLVQFLVSPIPRFIWPDKPASELVWFYTFFRSNIDIYNRAGNILPGIVAQYYMNWGSLGPILIGGIFGLLTKAIDLFLARVDITNDPYTYALAVMVTAWLFISYRLLGPELVYPVLISATIIWLSKKIGTSNRSIGHTNTFKSPLRTRGGSCRKI